MASNYQITCDLFILPYSDDRQILYAPRVGFVCAVNHDMVNLLADLPSLNGKVLNSEERAALDYLAEKGILNGSREVSMELSLPDEFSPSMVTLFPTNQCNLRCRYCYASAGDKEPLVMDWHYAVSAIDYLLENLKKRSAKSMSLGFHGGGEPLYPWQLVRRIVEYAEEECDKAGIKLNAFSATNGLLNERQLEWIVQHFRSLNVSFDGLPHVQDYHRPRTDGKGSFEFVDRTMTFLDEHEFNYGIRSTISSYNLDLMEESVDFIGEHYQTKMVHFEPLFLCGRCQTSDNLTPDLNAFYENFRKSESRCRPYGISFTYSGCRIENLTSSFCGVCRDNFSVTPEGDLTPCYEITSREDPRADTFFFGRIEKDGILTIDEEKRRFLHSLTVENLEFCRDCFAKWHCAGECVAKIDHGNYQGTRGHGRCKLNRKLIANRIAGVLEGTYCPANMKCSSENNAIEENNNERQAQ